VRATRPRGTTWAVADKNYLAILTSDAKCIKVIVIIFANNGHPLSLAQVNLVIPAWPGINNNFACIVSKNKLIPHNTLYGSGNRDALVSPQISDRYALSRNWWTQAEQASTDDERWNNPCDYMLHTIRLLNSSFNTLVHLALLRCAYIQPSWQDLTEYSYNLAGDRDGIMTDYMLAYFIDV
jgi:hypothetical protein